MDDEILDLVDRDDNVIGTINRMDYDRFVSDNLGYIRAVHLFILNSQDAIFTPIRTADKTIAPGGFDYSAGGHVSSGEDYPTALLREVKEELNIDISAEDLEPLGKGILEKIRYIHWTYVMRSDETPQYNPKDFASAEWLQPDELLRRIDEGHPAKSSLRAEVVRLKKYIANN
ncbi:MAG: hypothetical protein NVSMB39_7520 [Candidatus Saccharimonadales bacterium]